MQAFAERTGSAVGRQLVDRFRTFGCFQRHPEFELSTEAATFFGHAVDPPRAWGIIPDSLPKLVVQFLELIIGVMKFIAAELSRTESAQTSHVVNLICWRFANR